MSNIVNYSYYSTVGKGRVHPLSKQQEYILTTYAKDPVTGQDILIGRTTTYNRLDTDTKYSTDLRKQYQEDNIAKFEASLTGKRQGYSRETGSEPGQGDQRTTITSYTATSPDFAIERQLAAVKAELKELDDLYTLDYAKQHGDMFSFTPSKSAGQRGKQESYGVDPADGQLKKMAWDDFGKMYYTDQVLTQDMINAAEKQGGGLKARIDNEFVKTKDRTRGIGYPDDATYVAVTDPKRVEELRQLQKTLESQLTGVPTEFNQKQQDIGDGARTTPATTRTTTGAQPGSTGAPAAGPGETFGGTGALQTTQPTPGVTETGQVAGYTPPATTPVDPTTGVFTTPTQTGGLSALPPSVTYATRPAGTPGYVQESLLAPSLSGQGPSTYEQWLQQSQGPQMTGGYVVRMPDGSTRNISYGEPIPAGGVIVQYYSGESPVQAARGALIRGYQQGGAVELPLEAKYRLATMNGYRGPKSEAAISSFVSSNEGLKRKFAAAGSAFSRGGMVKQYSNGGLEMGSGLFGQPRRGDGEPVPTMTQTEQEAAASQELLQKMQEIQEGQEETTEETTEQTTQQPQPFPFQQQALNLMAGTLAPVQSATARITPQAEDFIPLDAGQAAPVAPMAEAARVQSTAQAGMPQFMTPASFTAQQAAPQVMAETARTQAAQGQVSQQMQAAQQQGTAVSSVEAAQGTAILMDNPVQREIQQGELISGSAVDATKVEQLNNQLQAAQATPTAQATVQGQLEGLMSQFEGGATPPWAAGAMRGAMAQLAARGLGASSLAGQAVVQAAMESALPIAQMDAQTRAQFEAQNLSNRQQTAMMAAQQRAAFLQLEFDQEFQSRVQNASRIADIANMNFTAEQQVALENSRIANTTNLQNLSNRQAKVMAEAAALANLDMANLNNRQQAAVQNAQAFLQMDLTNLSNEQQTGLFRAQQNIQALFTDQAAENAALQFNAASENQTNQFFSNLAAQVSQFNATQQNAMDQFNVNSVNAMRQFNSEVQQQRDLFNAQNGLVVAQANAQWRQNIATLNTAAQNQSNMEFARTINALTASNLDQIWQRERDIMNYAFNQSESRMDRALSILLADKELDAYREKMAADENNARFALGTSLLLGWD